MAAAAAAPGAAAGGRRGASEAYMYTPLAEALHLPESATRCNLYGVVAECTAPRPTRGSGTHTRARVPLPLGAVWGFRARCACTRRSRAPALRRCSHPHRRRRHADWVVNLTIVDNTTARSGALRSGVEVMVFGGDKASLPHLRQVGDIVRLHRVKARARVRVCDDAREGRGGRPCVHARAPVP
jgi:hypothetical protein